MRNMIKEAKAEGYKEGQGDTAKQTFKYLDGLWDFGETEGEHGGDTKIYITINDLKKLKKEYNIEE